MPIFNAAIDFQHRLITPRGIVCLRREIVPIVFVPASPSHYIDAGSASEHLAHIQMDGASIKIGIGLGHKAPVTLTPEVEGPLDRFDYAWNIFAAARLKQKYADVEVLG